MPIHISFDRELLCIVQGFLTALQTMPDGAHYAFATQTSGNAREHLLRFAILALGRFVLDLMCVSLSLLMRRSPIAYLTLPRAETNMTPVILSSLLYWRFLSNWNPPLASTFCGGALGIFRVPGTNEKLF
jgi:hypothetical protein